MSQNRYITFLGDPAGKPLRYTFHRTADFRAGFMATAVAACAPPTPAR
jgi:hypothetical protein